MLKLSQIIGQDRNVRLIKNELKSDRRFRHVLLYGPAGLGKNTLAHSIAQELGADFRAFVADSTWDARKIEKELLGLPIDGYKDGGIAGPGARRYVFFVDEVHLCRAFEPFYEPLQSLQVVQQQGGLAWIPDTTFIFATSKIDKLPKPFRDRISLKLRVDPYSEADLIRVIKTHRPNFDSALAAEVARRSRGTARIALDFAESVDRHGGLGYFNDAEIDERGLTTLDREYLRIVREADRPVSIGTVASMLGESPATVQDIVEPWLLTLGMIAITNKGRVATGGAAAPGSGNSRGSNAGSSARILSSSGGCVASQPLNGLDPRSNSMCATSSVSTEVIRPP
jgi:Holliday junction DNA helicase RuvB